VKFRTDGFAIAARRRQRKKKSMFCQFSAGLNCHEATFAATYYKPHPNQKTMGSYNIGQILRMRSAYILPIFIDQWSRTTADGGSAQIYISRPARPAAATGGGRRADLADKAGAGSSGARWNGCVRRLDSVQGTDGRRPSTRRGDSMIQPPNHRTPGPRGGRVVSRPSASRAPGGASPAHPAG